MKKYFLAIIILLFWISFVSAHVGEPVEEHQGEEMMDEMMKGETMMEAGEAMHEEEMERIPETRIDIGPIFFGGVLAVGLLGFLVWNVVKK